MQKRPLKVFFLIGALTGGGAENTLVNFLKHVDRNRIDPTLVLLQKKGEMLKRLPEDIPVIDLKKTGRLDVFRIIRLMSRRLYPDQQPDIVFSLLDFSNILNVVSAKRTKKKYRPITVVSQRNNPVSNNRNVMFSKIKLALIKKFYRQADSVTAICRELGDFLISRFRVPEEKLSVLFNSVDLEYVRECGGSYGKRQKRPFTFLFSGRLEPQKNIPLLLTAFQALTFDSPGIRLEILGQGSLEHDLKELVRKLEIGDKVIFHGFLDNPFAVMADADVFVLSSSWEGFGNVLIEAMALGVPVISTDCPFGPSEILGKDEYGLLVPHDDAEALKKAMIRLKESDSLRKTLAAKGNKRAEDFSVTKMTEEYTSLLERVYSSSKTVIDSSFA